MAHYVHSAAFRTNHLEFAGRTNDQRRSENDLWINESSTAGLFGRKSRPDEAAESGPGVDRLPDHHAGHLPLRLVLQDPRRDAALRLPAADQSRWIAADHSVRLDHHRPALRVVLNTGNRIATAQRAAGLAPTANPWIGFLLLFLFGLTPLYYQMELDKIIDHYGLPEGTPITLAV